MKNGKTDKKLQIFIMMFNRNNETYTYTTCSLQHMNSLRYSHPHNIPTKKCKNKDEKKLYTKCKQYKILCFLIIKYIG